MPKRNPEHEARLEIRLPRAMLKALKWTAEHDRLPLSAWIRDALNRRCYSIQRDHDYQYKDTGRERLGFGKHAHDRLAERARSDDDDLEWIGERRRTSTEIRTYTGIDGDSYAGSLPDKEGGKDQQLEQDFWIDRGKARTELRNWMHRWGRERKTLRLHDDELRLVRKLLAKFDRDPA